MYPRQVYEMTESQLQTLKDAFKPVPVIMIGGCAPSSQQENANRAWDALGRELGFDGDTVKPVSGKGIKFFSAIPSENATQRAERLLREQEEAQRINIARLEKEIADKQQELNSILGVTLP